MCPPARNMRPAPSPRMARRAAWRWPPGACCAATPLRAAGLIPSLPLPWQELSPTNHYHRTSTGQTAGALSSACPQACNDKEVSFGRNSQSQSSRARPRRGGWRRRGRHALHDGLRPVVSGGFVWLSVLLQTQACAASNDADSIAGTDLGAEPAGNCPDRCEFSPG